MDIENKDDRMNEPENGEKMEEKKDENTDNNAGDEYRELNDKFIRLFSEFDNYKKRTQKERIELIATASEKVISDILPVMDDYERAIKANEIVEDATVLKEGFELIYQKLLQILQKYHVEPIGATGEDFDTDLHEAIAHVPSQNKKEKGKVMDVIQKGYKIKEKIIRYAKVVVGD
jgi:molecular chaperone GrpE